jgi:hypothetical protein
VSNAGRSYPARRSAVSITAATSFSGIPLPIESIAVAATGVRRRAASRNTDISAASFTALNRSINRSVDRKVMSADLDCQVRVNHSWRATVRCPASMPTTRAGNEMVVFTSASS